MNLKDFLQIISIISAILLVGGIGYNLSQKLSAINESISNLDHKDTEMLDNFQAQNAIQVQKLTDRIDMLELKTNECTQICEPNRRH